MEAYRSITAHSMDALTNCVDDIHAKQEYPEGAKSRRLALASFKTALKQTEIKKGCGVKASYSKAKAFWDNYRKENPTVSDVEVRAMQRKVAAARKKQKRNMLRREGISTTGTLLQEWRLLTMGDQKEEIWAKKLSFIPTVQLGHIGAQNLARLQSLNEKLIQEVRLRGGATTTQKHKKGKSLGRTVAPGGTLTRQLQEREGRHVSGSIQMARGVDAKLQKEVTDIVTACLEEAFGMQHWYRATKQCFSKVPSNRRLPHSSLPGSNIWWSWKGHKQMLPPENEVHIDTNTLPPCFVFCPHTYKGAELLLGAGINRKIPMPAGRVVGGSWQRFPHCNAKLSGSEDRYSFVVYFNYRMLQDSYLNV